MNKDLSKDAAKDCLLNQGKKKRTLWPLFMDGFQLPQG